MPVNEHDEMDAQVVAAVARGVIELASAARPAAFQLPYPPSIQLALDRVVLAGLTRDLPVPAGVPELMSWCRSPGLEGWPLTLPDGFLTAGACLILATTGQPTRTCAELASFGPHGVLEQEAEALLASLADSCGSTDRYSACRDFLIHQPVILNLDPMELLQPKVAQTWNLVKGFYGPVPDHFPVDGIVYCCGSCGLLGKPATTGDPWCEGGCLSNNRDFKASHEPRLVRVLPVSLRLFLALPGRTEQAIRSKLTLKAHLHPFGLGIHRAAGPNGALRLFQIHDREQPVLSALRAAEVAARLGEPLDLVVPDRLAANPGYRQHFDHALPTGAQVQLFSASEFTAPNSPGRARRNYA
jgi:pPIWI_RE three-gene island domain Y